MRIALLHLRQSTSHLQQADLPRLLPLLQHTQATLPKSHLMRLAATPLDLPSLHHQVQ
jgi:hypothetical protein